MESETTSPSVQPSRVPLILAIILSAGAAAFFAVRVSAAMHPTPDLVEEEIFRYIERVDRGLPIEEAVAIVENGDYRFIEAQPLAYADAAQRTGGLRVTARRPWWGDPEVEKSCVEARLQFVDGRVYNVAVYYP